MALETREVVLRITFDPRIHQHMGDAKFWETAARIHVDEGESLEIVYERARVYRVLNDRGQFFAVDGEGYTDGEEHAASFVIEEHAKKEADHGESDVVVLMMAPLTQNLLRLVWNTALLQQAKYAGTDPDEDALWIKEVM